MEVSFVTLLLGLVTGVRPVTVAVSEPVAAVELRLDGKSLDSLRGEPWTFQCDFGTALRPHELLAIATDAEGRAVGRAVQWVNLPRRRAEVSLALEPGQDGSPAAVRMSWESLEFDKPKRIEARLDGKPIEAGATRIELPSHLADSIHLLTVRLAFPRNVVATAELAFGGPMVEGASAELTAVPIVLDPKPELPRAEEMQDWFEAGGEPLRVVAVERSVAEVVIVRDSSTGDLRNRWRGQLRGGSLAPDDVARLLLPSASAEARRGGTVFLFDISPRYRGSEMSIPMMLAGLEPAAAEGSSQSLADAVCVAGLQAAETNSRRAVVLVLGRALDDESTYSVESARAYLRDLHVPLVVWTLEEQGRTEVAAAWLTGSDPFPIPNYGQLDGAVRALRKTLASQAIVWVSGRHLPQEVTPSRPDLPVRLAGLPEAR